MSDTPGRRTRSNPQRTPKLEKVELGWMQSIEELLNWLEQHPYAAIPKRPVLRWVEEFEGDRTAVEEARDFADYEDSPARGCLDADQVSVILAEGYGLSPHQSPGPSGRKKKENSVDTVYTNIDKLRAELDLSGNAEPDRPDPSETSRELAVPDTDAYDINDGSYRF